MLGSDTDGGSHCIARVAARPFARASFSPSVERERKNCTMVPKHAFRSEPTAVADLDPTLRFFKSDFMSSTGQNVCHIGTGANVAAIGTIGVNRHSAKS